MGCNGREVRERNEKEKVFFTVPPADRYTRDWDASNESEQ